jgi:hypothetical protein
VCLTAIRSGTGRSGLDIAGIGVGDKLQTAEGDGFLDFVLVAMGVVRQIALELGDDNPRNRILRQRLIWD